MKKLIVLSLIIASCTTTLNAQMQSLKESILSELSTEKIPSNKNPEDTLVFKVVYPKNYDSTKTYPVFLGLSGGSQGGNIVAYCYAAWFKSDYFKDYLTIMPLNNNDKNLMNYSSGDIKNMLGTIKKNFQVTDNKWIIGGTSNGGLATFNFLAEAPSLFEGGIVAPGSMKEGLKAKKSWKHLKIILAYGEKDSDDWIKGTETTKKRLNKQVKSVQTIIMEGQEHILSMDYDIDILYKAYFEAN